MPVTHTPGPWTAAEQFDGNESLGIAISAGRQEIVRIHDISREGFANAAFIAAAPDMLAALQKTHSELAALTFTDSRITYAKERLRAAIARATLNAL